MSEYSKGGYIPTPPNYQRRPRLVCDQHVLGEVEHVLAHQEKHWAIGPRHLQECDRCGVLLYTTECDHDRYEVLRTIFGIQI